MSRKTKSIFLAFVIGIGLLTAGYVRYGDVYFKIKKNFAIFSEAYRTSVLRYVNEVDPAQLMDVALSAMLDSLDPYTTIIDKSKSKKLDAMTSGRYGGIGVEVGRKGEKMVVIAPMEGYPAQRMGVRAGDIILSVNDIPVEELKPGEIQDVMRGEPGTSVSLTVKRYGVEQPITFELERETIEIYNVSFSGLIGKNNNIGYILLNRFSKNASDEVRRAIENFQKKTEMEGLILDVRNNPGGLLSEAVKTVDKFIKPGITVVETRGRTPEQNHVYTSEEPALVEDLPLVVLQNSGSASASEVMAGALQDLDRAVVIGQQSFGKGLVQVVRSLPYDKALKITTAKYYTPSGRSIQSVNYAASDSVAGEVKPDSVKEAFQTRNGRTVYDSEGIIPDIKIADDTLSLLGIELRKNSHYFFFANRYASNHDTLTLSNATDTMYSTFRSYLRGQDFSFRSRTEKEYLDLKQKLASDTLQPDLQQSLQKLSSYIEKQKEKMYKKHSSDIREQLYLELIARYRGKEGRVRASTRFDRYIQKALSVLHQREKYRSILSINH